MKISISVKDREIQEFLKEFQNESPRAAAILGGAYLDYLLKELLKSRLVKDRSLFKELDSLTFERRMNLCYLTGIINRAERDDLKKINWIRNKFAHDIKLNTFMRGDISNECNNLKIINLMQKEEPFVEKPRDKYTAAIAFYTTILKKRIKNCQRIETQGI